MNSVKGLDYSWRRGRRREEDVTMCRIQYSYNQYSHSTSHSIVHSYESFLVPYCRCRNDILVLILVINKYHTGQNACYSLRTMKVVGEVENIIGKPVTSSNMAMAWDMMRLVGTKSNQSDSYGVLFSK